MRICLLTDQDIDSLPLPDNDWPCDPRPFLPEADWDLLVLEKETCVQEVVQASREGYDLFFNLCDGAWDEGRVGIEVVRTLEMQNVAFTGADSAFYEPSREAMKRVCAAWGVGTPAYVFVSDAGDVERTLDVLRFPMFVKHPSSYASNGLTQASRVTDRAGLEAQVRRMVDGFGAALVEEFIEGTECTVLVAESVEAAGDPIVYQPIQYRFPEGESFKHSDLKWVNYHDLTAAPVEDEALDARLREASALFFQGMRGTSYGRCDVRVDRDGRVFMLEINPNCGMYLPPTDPGSADLILAADPAGHDGFTRHVVEAALARHARRQRPWAVLPRGPGDYGTFATRAIAAGERIVRWEEQPHHLVTWSHVQRSWDARHRAWFARDAWPLTDEIWVTWSDDPEDWRPINHACDPNAWIEGLDVVARRPIEAGEEVTLEYATFYDERMPAFECACDASSCRGTIRGEDHLLDAMAAYEGHMSGHVARRRAARGSPVRGG